MKTNTGTGTHLKLTRLAFEIAKVMSGSVYSDNRNTQPTLSIPSLPRSTLTSTNQTITEEATHGAERQWGALLVLAAVPKPAGWEHDHRSIGEAHVLQRRTERDPPR